MIQPIGSNPVNAPSSAVLPAMGAGIPKTKIAMTSEVSSASSAA